MRLSTPPARGHGSTSVTKSPKVEPTPARGHPVHDGVAAEPTRSRPCPSAWPVVDGGSPSGGPGAGEEFAPGWVADLGEEVGSERALEPEEGLGLDAPVVRSVIVDEPRPHLTPRADEGTPSREAVGRRGARRLFYRLQSHRPQGRAGSSGFLGETGGSLDTFPPRIDLGGEKGVKMMATPAPAQTCLRD